VKLTRQLLTQMMYPIGLVHFAALVFGIIVPWAGSQFQDSLLWLFLRALLILSPLYIGAAVLVFAMQSKHGETWRGMIETILRFVPLVGSARNDLTMARLALALEALISAGVNIVEAWPMAASATASPRIKRVIATWPPELDMGHTPAELVRRSSVFTDMFANFYASGEASGRLDESLHRLREYYQQEGTRKMEMIAEWTPRIVYAVVAAVIAFKVIQFYTGYFNQIGKITGGF
jgi:type II secretory pathway component PulF